MHLTFHLWNIEDSLSCMKYEPIFSPMRYRKCSIHIWNMYLYLHLWNIENSFIYEMCTYIFICKIQKTLFIYEIHTYFSLKCERCFHLWNIHLYFHLWNIENSISMYDMFPYFHMRNMENSMFICEYAPMSYMKYQKFYFHIWTMHPCFHICNIENSIFIHKLYIHVFIYKILKIPFSSMKYTLMFSYMTFKSSIFILEICTHDLYVKYRKFYFHIWNMQPWFIYEIQKILFHTWNIHPCFHI